MNLPDGLARTWCHLLAYASREDGEILTHDISFIASRIGRKKHEIERLLVISEGRFEQTEVGFTFRDWRQWNKERDISTDRVRAYRQKKRVSSVSVKQLHETSETSPLRLDKIREEKIREESPTPLFLRDLKIWNERTEGIWDNCHKLTKHLLRAHSKAVNETDFDLNQILTKALVSEWLPTQRFVSLYWLCKLDEKTGDYNYRKILADKYPAKVNGFTQQQPSETLGKPKKCTLCGQMIPPDDFWAHIEKCKNNP